tara:strand:+ start:2580 stop:3284 length:705 start_codon:yes stop_codon:yes gene_type:complete
MAYGKLQAGEITPGSGNTLSVKEAVTFTGVATLPSPVINTGVSGSAILNEDAFGSNSDTKLATQQSIKAYVDALKTGSSITTLGTVTAGNLANTAIAFPVGFIVQTVTASTTTAYNATNDTGQATNLSKEITRLRNDSNYLITVTASMSSLSVNKRGGLRIKNQSGTEICKWESVNNYGDAMSAACAFRFIVASPPSGATTYTVWTYSRDSTEFVFNIAGTTGSAVITIQEIQT